ncbi:hypothetical protein [Streptomyces chattanoogensis]|uniref:hypothetical protein n=1 Tax=Streptomyces chattanoogensis TaxID=66876 RepID=UPI0005D78771|nr:hypothetical protein T261_2471 [Streptomyces lydicus]
MNSGSDTVGIADDEILAGTIILGIRTIRDHLGCSVHDALDAYVARYQVLRQERPDDFATGHEEYWANFSS